MEVRKILNEMVKEAAKEIGWEFNEKCVEDIEEMLLINYDIELNNKSSITWQIFQMIAVEVEEWQKG